MTDVLDLIGEELQRAAQRRVRGSHRSVRVRLAVRSLRAAPHDRRWRRRWRPLTLVLVLCFGGGTGALAAAGVFRTNASGETYGSSAGGGAAGPAAQESDLISAIGTGLNGSGHVTGYVLRSQLDADTGADVTTPAQAVAWTEAHTGSNATAVSIPLYAQDGTTVVGTFTIGPAPAPTITTAPTGTSR